MVSEGNNYVRYLNRAQNELRNEILSKLNDRNNWTALFFSFSRFVGPTGCGNTRRLHIIMWELTVVLAYYIAMRIHSRIVLLNISPYSLTTTMILNETYSRIGLQR